MNQNRLVAALILMLVGACDFMIGSAQHFNRSLNPISVGGMVILTGEVANAEVEIRDFSSGENDRHTLVDDAWVWLETDAQWDLDSVGKGTYVAEGISTQGERDLSLMVLTNDHFGIVRARIPSPYSLNLPTTWSRKAPLRILQDPVGLDQILVTVTDVDANPIWSNQPTGFSDTIAFSYPAKPPEEVLIPAYALEAGEVTLTVTGLKVSDPDQVDGVNPLMSALLTGVSISENVTILP